jgi:hypothetical protein
VRLRFAWLFTAMFLGAPSTGAQSEAPDVVFRRGNENAARSRWDDAMVEYGRLAAQGVRAPSLYWNWAQAAAASGKKGEALWALMRARELAPTDPAMIREVERFRGELGLDPSEVSLGFLGDLRMFARRFRFDGLAIAALLLSTFVAMGKKKNTSLSLGSFALGILLAAPFFAGSWREPRAVVAQKDAPLLDAPRNDALALSNLREGEVVPLLGQDGEYVRIQDASGARGFAHRNDVRAIGE